MSLRGGLLAETTWALDTINIMLSDDQTHVYLHLKQVPGLLQAFIDIYTKCLAQLFEEFKIENEEILNKSETKCQDEEEKDSVIYRIESNCLNKYQRKHVKQHNIIFENVYDDNGNLKHNPENVRINFYLRLGEMFVMYLSYPTNAFYTILDKISCLTLL